MAGIDGPLVLQHENTTRLLQSNCAQSQPSLSREASRL
jgi:hypothetical protein